ncbi:MAG: response regulator [Candidatus Peribacteraceae bacterium]|nr:response regulator [Candidatus Peribacteraceae bacterium]MDD5074508.1 response regulator [Candidatus Peribacteraceae bacterium]
MKLAVIKDNGTTKEVVRLAQDAGFAAEDILVARSREEALTLLEKLIPDVAVIDPHLTPHNERLEDGIDVIRTLRGKSKECIIICFTMGSNTELGVRALQAGAQDYIDASWPRVNWCSLLRERLNMWRGVALERAEHDEK